MDHVKLYVSENRPPICLIRSSNITWHYVIVVGYNDEDETISLVDPAEGAITMMSQHAFVEAWSFNRDMFGRKIKPPDFIGGLLRLADVSNYTLIVPMHANSFGG